MTQQNLQRSFTVYRTIGMAVDPIHVGTGGSHLGRVDRKSTRLNSSHIPLSRMPSSA